MPYLFPLFEHAAGYALFKSVKYKDIDTFKNSVHQSLVDLETFTNTVELVAFNPFKNTRHALDNMNSLSEGILHPELESFLENSVSKKDKNVIGIADTKLAAAISELGYTCSSDKAVHDLIRGIRTHFHNLVEGFEDASAATKSQLGLGHYYSRARVKFNVNRMDNMIIQSISLLDQLDKDINTFTMRVREWYSLHFPELLQVVPENTVFIQCVNIIKNRKEIDGLEEELENVVNDSLKVDKIGVLARSSMGMDIGGPDLENVYHFVDRIISMSQKRKETMEYLKSKMNNVAPNLATLIGDVVGARLIAHSGSLTNLAKAPASTVQILGAEKALFRALKTRGNTPKFGLLFHSKFIAKATKEHKGRISRYLANKCSVASRIDCFRDNPTNIFGGKLREQVENRLEYYHGGPTPQKNVDIMTEAVDEATIFDQEFLKQQKKAEKKVKKKLQKSLEESVEMNGTSEALDNHVNENEATEMGSLKKKKKAKKAITEMEAVNTNHVDQDGIKVPKTKKRKLQEMSLEVEEEVNVPKKRKKSKKNKGQDNSLEEIIL